MSANPLADTAPAANQHVEEVEVSGHIIDSLILPKILDVITAAGGAFRIKKIAIGQARSDPSFALLEVSAPSAELLSNVLGEISDHGAVSTAQQDCRLVAADIPAAFPEGFYSTTNQRTQIRINHQWLDVADQEMDCGVVVDSRHAAARCIPMTEVTPGMSIVVGHAGVRVFPHGRATDRQDFEFMNSAVSTEKPKGVAIRRIADELTRVRQAGGKTVLVGGPAIVHTGSVPHVSRMIRAGYINLLLAGNALATHDIEQSLFGTSLGVHLERGDLVEAGHEHHLRAINRIRRLGGIRQAVEQGALTSGRDVRMREK